MLSLIFRPQIYRPGFFILDWRTPTHSYTAFSPVEAVSFKKFYRNLKKTNCEIYRRRLRLALPDALSDKFLLSTDSVVIYKEGQEVFMGNLVQKDRMLSWTLKVQTYPRNGLYTHRVLKRRYWTELTFRAIFSLAKYLLERLRQIASLSRGFWMSVEQVSGILRWRQMFSTWFSIISQYLSL